MTTKTKRVYVCALCGRKMKRWIYSKVTHNRYCYPTEGCNK